MREKAESLLIGAHTSAQGGAHNAILEGKEIGATTVQLFTSNQRQWEGRSISDEEVLLFKKTLKETGLKNIMSHASYLLNLGSPDKLSRTKSQKAFKEELERCHKLQLAFLNFHPGSALKDSEEACLEHIVKSLLSVERLAHKGKTRLLIEATAGQGSNMGWRFEHLAYIVDRVHAKLPIGVCIDTCHIFAAGYDIRTKKAWEATLKAFDQIVGIRHLYAFHLNDSVHPLGSRRDRHASLGEGEIGLEGFRFAMQHPKLRSIPKYLETPEGPHMWKKEIALLRKYGK